eukprot:3938958-Pyramimonas_sp.AAC.1
MVRRAKEADWPKAPLWLGKEGHLEHLHVVRQEPCSLANQHHDAERCQAIVRRAGEVAHVEAVDRNASARRIAARYLADLIR